MPSIGPRAGDCTRSNACSTSPSPTTSRSSFTVNFANDDPAAVTQLLSEPGCVLGLSDAGAHVGQICDAVMPLDFLAHWVRDRGLMTVEAGIRRLTGELADLIGLRGRGYLTEGAAADVVVLDWDPLDPGPTRRVTDFPAAATGWSPTPPPGCVTSSSTGSRSAATTSQSPRRTLPGQLLRNRRRIPLNPTRGVQPHATTTEHPDSPARRASRADRVTTG